MGEGNRSVVKLSRTRKELLLLMAAAVLGGALFGVLTWRERSLIRTQSLNEWVNRTTNMKITSPAFDQNGEIPVEYTCDGHGGNPPLDFSGVPSESKTLALIVDDPDAPAGTWVHWTVWNIDPSAAGIAADSAPEDSVEGTTSYGKTGWGPPCPPSGTHRYFFKLYALDTTLDLPASADAGELEDAMDGHILDKAGLVGLYSRK